MVEPTNKDIGIANQCRVLNINRSTFYYKKKPVKQKNLDLMRQIDQQYLEHPSFGSQFYDLSKDKLGEKIRSRIIGYFWTDLVPGLVIRIFNP